MKTFFASADPGVVGVQAAAGVMGVSAAPYREACTILAGGLHEADGREWLALPVLEGLMSEPGLDDAEALGPMRFFIWLKWAS
ncbi:hypothetical protein AC482_05120, partial [miscellaneous Crenarchaeota group-15 archaeon DG-45]